MIKWEDIVKDKLEGYEKPLQDGSLASFHDRRDAAAGTQETKQFPIFWVMAAAVAAGIAALLFLRRPGVPDDAIHIIPQPSEVVAVSMDSVDVCETVETTPLVAQAVTPKASRPPMEAPAAEIESGEPVDLTPKDSGAQDEIEEGSETPADDAKSPFVPAAPDSGSLNMDVANAATSIIGSSGIALACINLPKLFNLRDYNIDYSQERDFIQRARHFMPLRAGLSFRVPISDRLSITSGIDYSFYFSRLHFAQSGRKQQTVHYIGVPLRLDGTLATNKWFDVYVGGGLEAEYCISAKLNGNPTAKSGFGLSVQAAGGIQYNLTERLGLYLEPVLSLPLMTEDRLPISYHTTNPVEFSVITGIRITISE